MDYSLANTLYRWAKNDAEKQAQIEVWLDDAISAIAEGKGSQLTSSSGNGVSVTFSQGLTFVQWANILGKTLQYLENGGKASTSIARLG